MIKMIELRSLPRQIYYNTYIENVSWLNHSEISSVE